MQAGNQAGGAAYGYVAAGTAPSAATGAVDECACATEAYVQWPGYGCRRCVYSYSGGHEAAKHRGIA